MNPFLRLLFHFESPTSSLVRPVKYVGGRWELVAAES